jgi:hypothetical protein
MASRRCARAARMMLPKMHPAVLTPGLQQLRLPACKRLAAVCVRLPHMNGLNALVGSGADDGNRTRVFSLGS